MILKKKSKEFRFILGESICVCPLKDGNVAFLSKMGDCSIRNLNTGIRSEILKVDNALYAKMLCLPDGKLLIVSAKLDDKLTKSLITVVDPRSMQVNTIEVIGRRFFKIHLMKSGKLACLVDSKKSYDIEIWDLGLGKCVSKIIRPKTSKMILFSEDVVLTELEDGSLVTVSEENLIEIWSQGYNNLERPSRGSCILQ